LYVMGRFLSHLRGGKMLSEWNWLAWSGLNLLG
jgi:hypothetical protein